MEEVFRYKYKYHSEVKVMHWKCLFSNSMKVQSVPVTVILVYILACMNDQRSPGDGITPAALSAP